MAGRIDVHLSGQHLCEHRVTAARSVHPGPLGPMLLVAGDDGLRELGFLDEPAVDAACEQAGPPRAVEILTRCAAELDAWFAGTLQEFTVPLAPQGTPFQRRVWDQLARIPFGRTTTYGEIAAALGDPKCVRAVGSANGANPIAILIPCHRVIGKDGSLVGYAGGLERKRALLELEGVGNSLFGPPRPAQGADAAVSGGLWRRTDRMFVRPLVRSDREEWIRMSTVSADLARPWSPRPAESATFASRFDAAFPEVAPGAAPDRPKATAAEERSLRLAGFLPDGRIAALLNLSEIVRGPFQNAYAGWSVNAECAGQGYATEGVLAMLDIAFAPAPAASHGPSPGGVGLGLHRVQASIMPSNEASLRVAARCGFRCEGLALRYLEIAGRWEDHALYAIVRE